MAKPEMAPEEKADATITIDNQGAPGSDLTSVPNGGTLKFKSAGSSSWEVQFWDKDNTECFPLTMKVKGNSHVLMFADIDNTTVNFSIIRVPDEGRDEKRVTPDTGGSYTIRIGSGGPVEP